MLKALLLPLLILVLAGIAPGQNLVPNPSFEDTTYCNGWPQPQLEALHWHTANTATPDIWNCDTANTCGYTIMDPTDGGVQNQGYKYAYDGHRFAAGYHWYGYGSSNTREYISAKLLQPLAAGQNYLVTLWCARPNGLNGAIDHIGAYFGPDSVYEDYPNTLPLIPQAELRDSNSDYIVDTAWVQLIDTITAVGNEQWIIVGTFDDADDVEGIWLGWGSTPPQAYYYIDLLTVERLHAQGFVDGVSPSPVLLASASRVTWIGPGQLEDLLILDGAGRTVLSISAPNGQREFEVPDWLSGGVYLVRANVAGAPHVARFVK